MKDFQMTTLWLGATRYHLGRATYAVRDFCELLAEEWDKLPKPTQSLIKRDVEEEFERDDIARAEGRDYKPLGHDCDRQAWEELRGLWR